jgi:VWFA-related protein
MAILKRAWLVAVTGIAVSGLGVLEGYGDSVVLEDSKSEKSEYAGLVSVQGRRKAVILIASGWDTFSKINYGQARKIIQNAGIPIYVIGTGGMLKAMYGDRLPAVGGVGGAPGRMDLLQAENQLKTFALETGGAYYPFTFDGEIPGILQNINAMLRSQYSLAYVSDKPLGVNEFRRVQLTARDKGLNVQSRDRYFAREVHRAVRRGEPAGGAAEAP